MSKETWDRSKPHVNIGTIGHVDHGKTTLTAAIKEFLHPGGNPPKPRNIDFDCIDNAPEEKERGITIQTSHVEYETANRHYAHVDVPGHADYVKNLITGASQLDGMLLVQKDGEAVSDVTLSEVGLARRLGLPLVMYLSHTSGTQLCHPILPPALEKLLPDTTPVLCGDPSVSLRCAQDTTAGVETTLSECETALVTLSNLMAFIDDTVPLAEHPDNLDLLVPIEDISPTGRGTVVTGKIETGVIYSGDVIDIVGHCQSTTCTATEVEYLQCIGNSQQQPTVRIELEGIALPDIKPGMAVAAPGSIAVCDKFKAEIYILKEDEGGRPKPFSTAFRPSFFFQMTDVTGNIRLEDGRETITPGDSISVNVKLHSPLLIKGGMRFAIREGGRTVGVGQVTRVPRKGDPKKCHGKDNQFRHVHKRHAGN